MEVSRDSGDQGCMKLFRQYHRDGKQCFVFPQLKFYREQFQLFLAQKQDILSTLLPETIKVPDTYCAEVLFDDCVHFVACAQLNRFKKEGCPGCATESLDNQREGFWFANHSEQRGGCLMGKRQALSTYAHRINIKYLDIYHIYHRLARLNGLDPVKTREDVRVIMEDFELDEWRLIYLESGVTNNVVWQQLSHMLINMKY